MRNQQVSPSPAIKADRRIDALVKQQTREHQHLIEAHNKEMQAMRDALKLAMDKFDSLFQKTEDELKDFKTYSVGTMGVMKVRIESQEHTIAHQKKTIDSLNEQLNAFHGSFSSTGDVDKVRKSLDNKINETTINNLVAFQDYQRELKILINCLKDDLIKLRCDMEIKTAHLTEKFDINFTLSHLEKEGVLKEIRIYEKSMFIIEKKIENIYTLIERINKRGALCPKPE
jgi:uncharacterized coiled-coil protein SlyX